MFWVEGSEFGGSRWGYLQSHQPLSEFRPYHYHHRHHHTTLQKGIPPNKTKQNEQQQQQQQQTDNINRPSLTITLTSPDNKISYFSHVI